MKISLSILMISLFQLFAFGQMEDHWPNVCSNVSFEYAYSETTNPLESTLDIDIVNINNTDTIFNYCDVFNTSTPGVTLTGMSNCYPQLLPNDTKTINIIVNYADTSIDCFTLDFKIKDGDALNPDSENNYCSESIQICKSIPIGIEEINRSNMSYTSVFYDLLGREKRKPLSKGFYIERKTYEDGFESTEKIFINLQ